MRTYSIKYLGLYYIDNHLTWNDHGYYVLKRMRAKLASIARLGPLLPRATALIYKVYLIPVTDYCDVVWEPSTKIAIKLDHLHSKATNLIVRSATCNNSEIIIPSSPKERRHFHVAIQNTE